MNSRNLIFFATWIILFSSSCTINPEPHPEVTTETNIDSGSSFTPEEITEMIRTSDSLKKVAAAGLPVSCSYEYGEDADFKKFVTIKLTNNTSQAVNSVKLNIEFSSFQNDLGNDVNFELNKRITIDPGRSKTIRYYTEYNINNIEVVKYGSKGRAEFNGLESLIKENRRKLNKQFPPVN
jgi:hypothetical protein